jgi:hypothetical protein
VLTALMVPMVLQVRRDQLDLRVQQELLAHKDRQVQQGLQAPLLHTNGQAHRCDLKTQTGHTGATLTLLVQQVRQVLKVRKVTLAPKVLLVQLVQQVLKARQARQVPLVLHQNMLGVAPA